MTHRLRNTLIVLVAVLLAGFVVMQLPLGKRRSQGVFVGAPGSDEYYPSTVNAPRTVTDRILRIPRRAISNSQREIAVLHLGIISYIDEYHAYPVGKNEEVVRKLVAGNRKGVPFIDFPKERLGRKDTILDPYGNPYQFAVDDTGRVEVRSAGKNGKYGDDDDDYAVTKRQIHTP